MDLPNYAIIAIIVAVVAVVVYVMDRRSKEQPVEVMDIAKFGLSAGGVAGGVVYAVGEDTVSTVVETVTTATQEMFVGRPEF